MKLHSHIISTIPVFQVSDPLEEVAQFFKDTTFSHVAIIEKGTFLGVLAETDLGTFEDAKNLEAYRHTLEAVFVHKETNWLDTLEVFSKNEANLIPVLEEEGFVLGYYDLTDIVGIFIETPFFSEPGGILVVAKGIKDYSFSEIAQIVESNNTKLLGAFITNTRNDLIQITLKVGATNTNEVVQTFRRYNYNILFGSKDDQFLEDLKQRSDYLDKYLNV